MHATIKPDLDIPGQVSSSFSEHTFRGGGEGGGVRKGIFLGVPIHKVIVFLVYFRSLFLGNYHFDFPSEACEVHST